MTWKYEDDICVLNTIRLLYAWREFQHAYKQ